MPTDPTHMDDDSISAWREYIHHSMKREPAQSLDVFKWPEFILFAGRLGIPLGERTTDLTIRMEAGSPVVVDHEFIATDKGDK